MHLQDPYMSNSLSWRAYQMKKSFWQWCLINIYISFEINWTAEFHEYKKGMDKIPYLFVSLRLSVLSLILR